MIDIISLNDTVRVRKIGKWRMEETSQRTGGMALVGKEVDASLLFSVAGDGIYFHVFKGDGLGSFQVSVDGSVQGIIDLNDPGEDLYETVVVCPGGPFGKSPHLIKIVVISPLVYIDSIYGRAIETVSPPLPEGQSVTVAKSGGDYTSLKSAINYVTAQNPTVNTPWGIEVRAGLFVEDNNVASIILPNYTSIVCSGQLSTVFQASSDNFDLFNLPSVNYLGQFQYASIKGPIGGSTKIGLKVGSAGFSTEIDIQNLWFYDFAIGFKGTDEAIVYTSFNLFEDCAIGVHLNKAALKSFGVVSKKNTIGDICVLLENDAFIKVSYLDIVGSYNEGIYCHHGGQFQGDGVSIDNAAIGVHTANGGIIRLGGARIEDVVGTSIKVESAGDVLKIRSSSVRIDNTDIHPDADVLITGDYPTRHRLSELANTIAQTLPNGTVFPFVQEDEMTFMVLDYFKGMTKIDTYNNVLLEGGDYHRAILTSTTTQIPWDDCESLTPADGSWVEYNYANEGAISLDAVIFKEGSHSIKANYTKFGGTGVGSYRYSVRRIISPSLDWSAYTKLSFWVKSTLIGSKLRIISRNFNPYVELFVYHTFATTDWELVTIDMSGVSHQEVYDILFFFTKEASAYQVNIDDFQLESDLVYDTSGWLESITKVPVNNRSVYEMLVGVQCDLPANTVITMDISLDGGNHWLTDIGLLWFENWLKTNIGGVLEKADGGVAWDNKKNLKVKFNLSTTDTAVTPKLDDYVVLWRVDRA